MTRCYFVETWDIDKQKFTPQEGVPRGPYSKWGLRKAIRKLEKLGYSCEYSRKHCISGDPCVSIWAEDATEEVTLFI